MPVAPLPKCWQRPPVYARFSVQLGKMLDEKRITGDHLAPYLRNIDVQWEHVNTTDLPVMDFSVADREQYSLRRGDLLVCEGGEVGRTAIWNGELPECFFQKAIHRLRPTTQHDDPRFFRYFMRMAVHGGFFTQTTASTIQHLPAEKLRVIRYPAPPIVEQRLIADFLDRQTLQIDALITAKRRLLDLSGEKRRTLIMHAVTRGFASERLRKSGVPWLSDVPESWQMRRIATLFTEVDERNHSDLPLLEVSLNNGVVLREFSGGRIEATAADFNTYKVARQGDIVFNKMRMWQGAVGVAPEDGLVSPDYVVARPPKEIRSDYAGLLFRTKTFSNECGSRSYGLVWDRLRLYWDSFREIQIPLPPLDQQLQIVQYIATETAKLDVLRVATEKTIALLKERRAALIAAAVTGQIDVSARDDASISAHD